MTSIVHFHTVDVMKTSSQASLEWTTTETQQRSLDNNDLQIRPHIRRGEGGTDPTTTRGKIKSSIMSTDKSSILVLLLIFVFCVSVWVVVKLYRRWCTCIQPQGQDEDEQRPEEDDSDLSSSIVKKTKQIEVAIQRQNCSMVSYHRYVMDTLYTPKLCFIFSSTENQLVIASHSCSLVFKTPLPDCHRKRYHFWRQ
mmetsp:Transcript_2009/g.4614  ORF Transcript_2009/g.4614 Transcript_2009/m.4614 type:complete len:196 (-) Transcript_2009:1833-2420(-)